METNITTFEMSIIMHCYYSIGPIPTRNAPIFQETMEKLEDLDLVEKDSAKARGFSLTGRGKEWLKRALNTPIPQIWME